MGNLNITQVTANQNNKEVTINDADTALESALTEILTVDLSAGNVTLTGTQFTRNMTFLCSGHTVARDLTIPATERAVFIVDNAGTSAGAVSVKRGTTTEVVPISQRAMFTTDGTANGLKRLTPNSTAVANFLDLADTPSSYSSQGGKFLRVNLAANAVEFFTIPYAIPIFVGDKPGAGDLVMQFICVENFALPSGLTGSQAKSGVSSTGNVYFDIYKNGSDIGDIVFNISSAGTFTLASTTSFVPGDLLQIYAPASQDATLADISITLMGVRN